MYNERFFLTSRHEITQNELTDHKIHSTEKREVVLLIQKLSIMIFLASKSLYIIVRIYIYIYIHITFLSAQRQKNVNILKWIGPL